MIPVPSQLPRLLFICYAFPPVGGAGVQRSVKFVKYLACNGWLPTVLSVANPSVPVLDADLLRDIPPETKILRTKTLEPSYRTKNSFAPSQTSRPSRLKSWIRRLVTHWLQPDLQVLWNGSAFRRASRELQQGGYSAIYVSGPPFSSFLIGCRLKRRFDLPLILDFRDEWSLSARYLENQGHRDRMLDRQIRMFESTIQQADAIIATTNASAMELARCCNQVGSSSIVRCITNGFDPSDFQSLSSMAQPNSKYRLVYTGTLWRLTNIEPLVRAIEQLSKNHPRQAANLELHLIGRQTPEQREMVQRINATSTRLCCDNYLAHQEALQHAKEADGLLLLLSQEPGAERVIPAKTFEYLALERPILGIVPAGETRDVLARAGLATPIDPQAIDSIEAWLVDAIDRKGMPDQAREKSDLDLEWCSRPFLTSQLAGVLNQVIDR